MGFKTGQFNQAPEELNMTYHATMSCSRLLVLFVFCGAGLLSACSWIPKGDANFDVGIKDRGVASWYGEQFHGKQAANGEIFDMDALTAAHRTMPLGSIVRVVNLENGRYLHVRITDRGPYVNGRILDLSRGAAARLGMEQGGLAMVQIEIVGDRSLDMFVSSDARMKSGSTLLLGSGELSTHSAPVLAHFFRILPGDIWTSRRIRGISAMIAANHTAHAEVPTLALG